MSILCSLYALLLAMIAGMKPVSTSTSISIDRRLHSERFANTIDTINSCVAFRSAFCSGKAVCHSFLPSLSSLLLRNLLGLHAPLLPTLGVDGCSRKSDGHPLDKVVLQK